MNKKGGFGVVLIIVGLLLLVVSVVVVSVIAFQKGYFTPKPDVPDNSTIRFFIQTADVNTRSSVNANYKLQEGNKLISEGELAEGELRELLVNPNYAHLMTCWGDDYYLTKAYRIFIKPEIDSNKATFSCDMSKIEKDLKVKITGSLVNKVNELEMNLTAKDKFKKVVICSSWTSGFLDVSIKNQIAVCESGVWKNYTDFNATTSEYIYLPKNQYSCGEEIENCEAINGANCRVVGESIPMRYLGKVDNCDYLGRNINEETVSIPISIEKSEFTSRLDEITFYILDKDRRWFAPENMYVHFTEFEGQDIGAEDIKLTIKYEDYD